MKTLDRGSILEILKDHNIKITPNRLVVAEVILNSIFHPSIDEIHTKLIRDGRNISFTSVYNIIKTFEHAGLLKEIQTHDRCRYDPNTKPHIHFICKTCSRVYDIDSLSYNIKLPENILGMKVESYELTYYGYCSECLLEKLDKDE